MIDVDKTAAFIAGTQRPDGAIPWFPGGKLDPWDHVEAAMGLDTAGRHDEAAAAYHWLARNQNTDGSWYAEYHAGAPADLARDANFTTYVAVGVHHHYRTTGDTAFLTTLWPTVDAAMTFVLGLRSGDGAVHWRRRSDGTLSPEVLLTGNCSIQHALTCAARLAGELGHPRPEWTTAAARIRDAVVHQPGRFLPKSLAMDWFYPVLTGILGTAHLDARWPEFVESGHGVRCVDHEPWTTGGETAELALALAVNGHHDRAAELLGCLDHLATGDGSYWTGYNYDTRTIWPEERTTWTAGAILLAHAAIHHDTATTTTFGPLARNLR
jgi:hypothetical protein